MITLRHLLSSFATAALVACAATPAPKTPDDHASERCLEGARALPPAEGTPHEELVAACEGDDAEACAEACARKGGDACFFLGLRYGETKTETCGVALYERACSSEGARGCAELARLHYLGERVREDHQRARLLSERACDAEVGFGCGMLGHLLDDPGARLEALRKGCELEDGLSCLLLGGAHMAGEGVPKNPTRATAAYRRGCEAGAPPACVLFGELTLAAAGGEDDRQAALAAFEKACALDDGRGCAAAAFCHQQRCAPRADPDRHPALLARACDLDFGLACAVLGAHLVDQPQANLELAAGLAARGCKLESGLGCLLLGEMSLDGEGVVSDPPGAAKLFAQACDLGEAAGCRLLLHHRWPALGIAVELPKVSERLGELCAAGVQRSCEAFSYAKWHGLGGEAEPERAREMMRAACEGDGTACMQRAIMELEAGAFTAAGEAVSRGLAAQPQRVSLEMVSAMIATFERRHDQAIAALERVRQQRDDAESSLYSALWIHANRTAKRRSGERALREAMKARAAWPHPIAEFLVGERKPETLVAEARKADDLLEREERLCEAYFFIGLDAFLGRRQKEARRWLSKAAATGIRDFYEYSAARGLLARLDQK